MSASKMGEKGEISLYFLSLNGSGGNHLPDKSNRCISSQK